MTMSKNQTITVTLILVTFNTILLGYGSYVDAGRIDALERQIQQLEQIFN
jgi:hypothetical protein